MKVKSSLPIAANCGEPRKIIQISSSSETADRYQTIIALCNDGTVWRMVARNNPEDCCWVQLQEIPQDNEGGYDE